MSKKMKKILEAINAKTAEAKSLTEGETPDYEKASALMDEVEKLQGDLATEQRIYAAEKANAAKIGKPFESSEKSDDEENDEVEKKTDATKSFAKAVRAIISRKSLVEGTGADGGYTVPEDVSTQIERYRDAEYSLLQDIDEVTVTTNKGSRTFLKKGEVDTFVDIDENGAITEEIDAPQFERLPYVIKDRAGFMPVSNDLIEDSDANILAVVTEWLGKADVATVNKKVLALVVANKTQADLGDLDGIRTAVNVTLGQAYKAGAKIYTNDDGLNYLDQLKDKNDRPLLNPDPTAPQEVVLRIGTVVLPVKVLPNKVWASGTNGKIPFIVGNLFDFVRRYNRKRMTLKASDTATIGDFNAFAQNMTVVRAILRDDYRVKDADSIVYGYISGE